MWLTLLFSAWISLSIPEVNTDNLLQRVQQTENDTLYVVNFWATWCKPCIAELPWFDSAGITHSGYPLKVLLVSLDFKSASKDLHEFTRRKKLQSEVLHLVDGNPDVWINRISGKWSGAIPATAFYKSGNQVHFHEGSLTSSELNSLINQFK